MKRQALIIAATAAILFSQVAHSSAGWTDYANVAELVPTSRHYYKFRLPVRKNPSGCKDNNWFYQDYGSLGSDKMFNLLLEGIKSNLRLRVYVTGSCNIDGYSEISSVSIIP
ncbi:MAG: hypothetical protein OEU50_00940 [Gammaproteobacteria bacterium]|nr:hypothetical protein [Gammaproteobacteria bacterium]